MFDDVIKASRKNKREPLPKKKKLPTVTALKKKLWKMVSTYIRERDKWVCFTSGVKVLGSNAHAGHMIPQSVGGILLKYHPYNIHCQSYVENIHHSGNGAEYYRRAVGKYGQEEIDKLFFLKEKTTKADRYFFTTMIELYEQGDEKKIIDFLYEIQM